MSQILSFIDSDAGYLCVDSNIVYDEIKTGSANKLFITDKYIIASAGLAFGIDIIESFVIRSKNLEIEKIEDIEEYFLTIANSQYRQFIMNYSKVLKKDLTRVYFVYIAKDYQGKLSMGLVGAEGEEDLKKMEVKNIVSAPRRISVEMAFVNLKDKNESLVVNLMKKSMKKISELDSNVKPPFQLAIIYQDRLTKKIVF